MLEVDVRSAHQLFGRRSQDPYALVYLLDKKGNGEAHAKTWFQENKMKTRTKDKTLDPVWNDAFEFVDVSDLAKKSLVIAIWDRDSTSDDDYMAGVRIPMEEVFFFDAHKGVVKLELRHQMADGHVRDPGSNICFKQNCLDLAWRDRQSDLEEGFRLQ